MKKDSAPQQPPSEQTSEQAISETGTNESELTYPKIRVRIGLALAIFGFFLFLLGARPSLFNLDRSRVIGFVQISVFLVGLGIITIGSYLTLNAFWFESKKTIAADIGARLISTGYVICVFTAMADIFGLGSHRLPNVYFGPLQAQGMMIGMATIAIGFLLLIRYKSPEIKKKSKQDGQKTDPDRAELENQEESVSGKTEITTAI